jgi:DNA modification methylase
MTDRSSHGDCVKVMRKMPWERFDVILTDPRYLVNYGDRSVRRIAK